MTRSDVLRRYNVVKIAGVLLIVAAILWCAFGIKANAAVKAENDRKELCSHVQAGEGDAKVQAAGVWWVPQASERQDSVNSSILVLVFNMALQKQFVLFTLKFPEKLKHPQVPIFHIYFRTMSCALLCTVLVKLLVPLKHN